MLTSISRSPLRCGFFILPIALCCFALSPAIEAGCPSLGGCAGANTAVGDNALFNVTTGVWNVGVGFQALLNDTDGNQNTGVGYQALFSNVSGDHSTAIGGQALQANTTGNDNVGVGFQTLSHNTTGNGNTGMGYRTLAFNDIGDDNTAIGWNALYNNRMHGDENTAVGSQALFQNMASLNTAVGFEAMQLNTTNSFSTAVGYQALQNTTSAGTGSTAIAYQALSNATSPSGDNTALGDTAGVGVTTGAGNIIIGGFGSGNGGGITTASSMISIGANPGNDPSRCYIGCIYGHIQPAVGTDPDYVTINSSGRLGRANLSSRQYKHDIKPMDKASEQLYGLKPVTFRYLKEYDATQTIAFGLIAEDVAQVYPDLVGRNKKGQPESVRYEQINAMMLNEFLKEHKKVEEQQAGIAELKSTVALQQKEMQVLTAQLKEQAAQIQKVSAQLEVNKPAPQVVANKP